MRVSQEQYDKIRYTGIFTIEQLERFAIVETYSISFNLSGDVTPSVCRGNRLHLDFANISDLQSFLDSFARATQQK